MKKPNGSPKLRAGWVSGGGGQRTVGQCDSHAEQVDEVAYVDKQRNIAISLGERDVKADVKAKNK